MANTTSLANIEIALTIRARMVNTNAGVVQTGIWEALGNAFSPAVVMTSGTGADQADTLLIVDSDTITSGNSVNLDLYDGAGFNVAATGADLLGNVIANVEITSLFIWNEPASAGDLILGALNATTAWNSIWQGSGDADNAGQTIGPDGAFAIHRPDNPAYAVADTTNHLLKIAASGGNVTYSVIALGRSA